MERCFRPFVLFYLLRELFIRPNQLSCPLMYDYLQFVIRLFQFLFDHLRFPLFTGLQLVLWSI